MHFLLWTTVVAGKRSDVQTKKFNELFTNTTTKKLLRSHGRHIQAELRKVGIGQYKRIYKCWDYIRKNISPGHLRTIKRKALTNIPGIGNKTASFFLAHSRAFAEVAVLDTHILKWLKASYPKLAHLVPKITPQTIDDYITWEALFLGTSCQMGICPADLDNRIWQSATNAQNNTQKVK
tara:strand:+ start:3078 stop:3614 length:537 start_codon:yes stop_codon:yes gene_type:complete